MELTFVRTCFALGLLVGVCGLSAATTNADDTNQTETATDHDSRLVRMPVQYDSGMIVVVSPQGAAAIRFATPTESANNTGNGLVRMSYDWRFVSREDPEKNESGSGRLYAKLIDGKFSHGVRDIKAGPIEILWRHRDNKIGYVEFDPQRVNVHPVTKRLFGDDQPQRGNARVVDLRRFLHSVPKNAAEHQADNKNDEEAETETHQFAGNVSGPLQYQDSVLVVRDPAGVATFRFGQVFDRHVDKTFRHYGVPYEFTLTSFDGKLIKSGQDEVYERYKNGGYDRGRLNLQAGKLQMEWSRGGPNRGWIYYKPTWTSVWQIEQADVDKLVTEIVAAGAPITNK